MYGGGGCKEVKDREKGCEVNKNKERVGCGGREEGSEKRGEGAEVKNPHINTTGMLI